MDSWSSSNEPRHLPRQMQDQPVVPNNVFPMYDPTVESHGLRPLLPASMTLSACLNDVQQQERRRLQLVRLEHVRSVNKRSRSRSASSSTSYQGSNSSGSLISSATSKNLKLVIQKVLKVRDFDSHGRIIVIPKKDAEGKLPYLHESVRMNIPTRDVFTGQIWKIKFRLCPNNGSKLHVLENTGEYIVKYKLISGDFFALFEDAHWKYYIGCKKLTVPRVPRGQALVVESEEGMWQRTTKDLVRHSDADDEEFITEASDIMKKLLDTTNEVSGDKGQSPSNAQTDGARTSRGVEGMNLETSVPQNDTIVIDEPMIDLDYLSAKQLEYFHFSGCTLEDFLDDFLRE